MVVFVLLTIFVLYILITILNLSLLRSFQKKICPICAAVFLAWTFYSLLWLLGVKIDPLILAILAGQSILGVIFSLEKLFSEKKLSGFYFVKISIVILASFLVYAFFTRMWIWVVYSLAVSIFILVALLLFVIVNRKGKTNKKPPIFADAIKTLEENLKKCC